MRGFYLLMILVVISSAAGRSVHSRRSKITDTFPALIDVDEGPTTEFMLGVAQAFDEVSDIFRKLFNSITLKKRIIGMDNPSHINLLKHKIN